MNSNSERKPSSADQELRELIKLAQKGDLAAKEKVFISILPTVTTMAKSYDGKGVPYDDLYQEACYGALIAMIHYDVNRSASFRTYAIYYMKKYLQDALFQQNINLPGCYNRDFYYEVRKYIDGVSRFKEEIGHEPTDNELSKYLNISVWRIKRLKIASHSFMLPSKNIDSISHDYCTDNTARSLEDDIFNSLLKEDLADILTPLESEVLNRRCNLNESVKPQTWAFISADMKLSVPTVQFAYRRAIAKVKKYLDCSE